MTDEKQFRNASVWLTRWVIENSLNDPDVDFLSMASISGSRVHVRFSIELGHINEDVLLRKWKESLS